MIERLADISARIDGISQLGSVVNAMKGIAAARAHVAREQVPAVDSYATIISTAMSSILSQRVQDDSTSTRSDSKVGLLVFCAEQGFAGAFSERVLQSIEDHLNCSTIFLVGTRGISIATHRGINAYWTAALPSHTARIPALANKITNAIYQSVAEEQINSLDAVFTTWEAGRPSIVRQALFPIDLQDLQHDSTEHPLIQIPEQALINSLGQDYFNAQVCKAALHAYAAENEARIQAMSSASSQIAGELETWQSTLRRVRQESITAEIIELGANGLRD